jgi:hypothetical protein
MAVLMITFLAPRATPLRGVSALSFAQKETVKQIAYALQRDAPKWSACRAGTACRLRLELSALHPDHVVQ